MPELARNFPEISRLCLGTLNFGVQIDPGQSHNMLDLFLAHGGNFIDTAHVYSNWLPGETSRSEKILGQWLKHRRREDVVVSTKGGHFDFAAPDISRVLPAEIVRDIDESLEYLQTEYIDLYFLHRDNEALPVDVLMDCLNEQVRAGKIRHIGCSNWRLPRLAEAQEYAVKNNLEPFISNQLMWSMAAINKTGIPSDYVTMDTEIFAYHKAHALSVMCYSAQAKGYFTKRQAGGEIAKATAAIYENDYNERLFQKLLPLSGRTGKTMTELALQYFAFQPFPAVPIVSCNTEEQLRDCMAAFEGDLTAYDVFEMENDV